MRVLLVEDDRKTAAFIHQSLLAEGWTVALAGHGEEALMRTGDTSFDAIVLDIMLPGRDGLSVVRSLRERGITTPVLLLSARGEVAERVVGLNAGADDYLAKPFALAELLARVRALGRRVGGAGGLILKVADLTLDTVSRKATRGERTFDLAAREFRLLEFLMRSRGRVCGRVEILEKVWDYDFDPGTNLVDVYVRRLREKVDDGFDAKLIHTVRGTGYALEARA